MKSSPETIRAWDAVRFQMDPDPVEPGAYAVVRQGDRSWYVAPLANGQWAYWEDGYTGADLLVFDSQEEALQHARNGMAAVEQTDPGWCRWVGPQS